MTGSCTDWAVSGAHLGWSRERVRLVSQLQLVVVLQSIVLLPTAVMYPFFVAVIWAVSG